jgi:hypothetical protein
MLVLNQMIIMIDVRRNQENVQGFIPIFFHFISSKIRMSLIFQAFDDYQSSLVENN